MSDHLFSGWGVRTLSTDDRGYNPIGYHVGTIWPHDNAIVALGLARYGFRDEANRIALAQLEAAAFTGFRLPEAFAGFERRISRFPVPYPTACSPQAWATGAPFSCSRRCSGSRLARAAPARPARPRRDRPHRRPPACMRSARSGTSRPSAPRGRYARPERRRLERRTPPRPLGVAPAQDTGRRHCPAPPPSRAWAHGTNERKERPHETQPRSPRGALERRALEDGHARVARLRHPRRRDRRRGRDEEARRQRGPSRRVREDGEDPRRELRDPGGGDRPDPERHADGRQSGVRGARSTTSPVASRRSRPSPTSAAHSSGGTPTRSRPTAMPPSSASTFAATPRRRWTRSTP